MKALSYHCHLGSYWGWPELSLRILSTLCWSSSSTTSNLKTTLFHIFSFSCLKSALLQTNGWVVWKITAKIFKYWYIYIYLWRNTECSVLSCLRHTKGFVCTTHFFPFHSNSISKGRILSFQGDRGRTRKKTYEHLNCTLHPSFLFL